MHKKPTPEMPNRYERECGYDVMRLPTQVRDAVLTKYCDWQVCDEWWDFVYEDAKRMGALMGIEVEDIQFSGFWSQGDGASFTGKYACEPDAVEAVTRECGGTDKELIRIATALTVLQTTWKLLHGGAAWECNVRRDYGGSVHAGSMSTGWEDERFENFGQDVCMDMDKQVEHLMRDFASWIYRQLENEYDHLTSEETVITNIRDNGLRFDSSGATI